MLPHMVSLVIAACLVVVSAPAMSEDTSPTCKDYGCDDCSCIARHPEIAKKYPAALSAIRQVLAQNGIPAEAVTIVLRGATTASPANAGANSPQGCRFCCFSGGEIEVGRANPEACGVCCGF